MWKRKENIVSPIQVRFLNETLLKLKHLLLKIVNVKEKMWLPIQMFINTNLK